MKKILVVIALMSFPMASITKAAQTTMMIHESMRVELGDDYCGNVNVQDSNGNRLFAQVYRSGDRVYLIFPKVVQRGSNNSASAKYWASRSTRSGFTYEVYYNGKTWYFNL